MNKLLIILLLPFFCYSQKNESIDSRIIKEFNQYEFHNYFFQNFAVQNEDFIYTYGGLNTFGTGRVTKIKLKDITSINVQYSTDDNTGGLNNVSGLVYITFYFESGKAQYKFVGKETSESEKNYSKDPRDSISFTFRNSYEDYYRYRKLGMEESLLKLISTFGGNAILK